MELALADASVVIEDQDIFRFWVLVNCTKNELCLNLRNGNGESSLASDRLVEPIQLGRDIETHIASQLLAVLQEKYHVFLSSS